METKCVAAADCCKYDSYVPSRVYHAINQRDGERVLSFLEQDARMRNPDCWYYVRKRADGICISDIFGFRKKLEADVYWIYWGPDVDAWLRCLEFTKSPFSGTPIPPYVECLHD